MNTREERIHDVILAQANEPFEWGTNDCCKFVGHVAEAILGYKIGRQFVYYTSDAANAIMLSHGGMAGFISHVLDRKPESDFGATAECGDPTIVRMRNEDYLGIYMNDYVLVKSENGLLRIRTKYITEGWHLCLKQ